MRNPNRIPKVLSKLEKAWQFVPDWRLGQLVSNLQGVGRQDVFNTEDDIWERLLDIFIKECEETIAARNG